MPATISTVAGSPGTSGPATSVGLSPGGAAQAANGGLYVADTQSSVVREIDASGQETTIAGNGLPGYSGNGGQATSARMYAPQGVAVDGGGDVLIADSENSVVRLVAATDSTHHPLKARLSVIQAGKTIATSTIIAMLSVEEEAVAVRGRRERRGRRRRLW